jgi:hypothetical protein
VGCFSHFSKTAQSKQLPIGRKLVQCGHSANSRYSKLSYIADDFGGKSSPNLVALLMSQLDTVLKLAFSQTQTAPGLPEFSWYNIPGHLANLDGNLICVCLFWPIWAIFENKNSFSKFKNDLDFIVGVVVANSEVLHMIGSNALFKTKQFFQLEVSEANYSTPPRLNRNNNLSFF